MPCDELPSRLPSNVVDPPREPGRAKVVKKMRRRPNWYQQFKTSQGCQIKSYGPIQSDVVNEIISKMFVSFYVPHLFLENIKFQFSFYGLGRTSGTFVL